MVTPGTSLRTVFAPRPHSKLLPTLFTLTPPLNSHCLFSRSLSLPLSVVSAVHPFNICHTIPLPPLSCPDTAPVVQNPNSGSIHQPPFLCLDT